MLALEENLILNSALIQLAELKWVLIIVDDLRVKFGD